jgi:F-type H+-transporting ATPase subunit gamma
VLTSDKGLAGAFNSNVIKAAQRFVADHPKASVEFELIGRKGRDFFRKRNAAITGDHIGLTPGVKYEQAVELAAKAMQRFRDEEIDAVYLLYNEFKSVMSQKLATVRVLPIDVPSGGEIPDYIYQQPPAQMLQELLPRYVEVEVLRALLETGAAELAARMTAMEAATSNASDMIDRLTLFMNRVRQASITKEIIEVVSGAAAAE